MKQMKQKQKFSLPSRCPCGNRAIKISRNWPVCKRCDDIEKSILYQNPTTRGVEYGARGIRKVLYEVDRVKNLDNE